MPMWDNGRLVLFHGCSHTSLHDSYRNQGGIRLNSPIHNIDLSLCDTRTDFGQGFYTTTSEHQAMQWANQQVRRKFVHQGTYDNAIVLRLEVDRNPLADLKTLTFVSSTADFWNFIEYCRNGFPPHAPQVQGTQTTYDVVYGPVSIWPQWLVVKDCDQISFHTPDALKVLPMVYHHSTGHPLFP
jgi:Protein of unknown function (DUF3990)